MCDHVDWRLTIVFALALAIGSVAFADEIKWTGLGVDTDWNTPENWEGGVVPTKDDIAVFDPGAGETAIASLSCTGVTAVPLGGARFLSGTVDIKMAAGGDIKPGIVLAGCDGSTTSVVEVAEGVVVNMAKGFRAPQVMSPGNSTPGVYTLLKTGKGTINTTGMFGHLDNAAGYFRTVDIAEGAMTFSANTRQTDYIVRAGALMHWKTGANFSNGYRSLFVEVDEGGEFRFPAVGVANFNGAGNFTANGKTDANVTFALNRGGPKLLSGRLGLGGGTNMTVAVSAQGSNSDDDYQLIVGASNTMAAVTRFEFDSEVAGRETVNHPIRFAPGVGGFWFDALGWKEGAPLVLEDTEGDPVDVYVKTHAVSSQAYSGGTFFRFGVTGKGNYYVTGTQAFTNDVFFNTGAIGAAGSGTMTLGTGVADKDVDLSHVSGTVAKDATSALTYKNGAALVQSGTLGGMGTVTFNGPGGVRIAGRTTDAPKVVANAPVALEALATEGGSVTALAETTLGVVPGTEAVLDTVTVKAGGKVTLTNGVVRGVYGENSQQASVSTKFNRLVPMGVTLLQSGNGMPLRVENGSFRVVWTSFYSDKRFHEIEIGPGGCVYQNGYTWPRAAAGMTPFILLDGGTYSPSEFQSYNSAFAFPAALTEHDVWQIRVTARGGAIAYEKLEHLIGPTPGVSTYVMTMNADFVDASGGTGPGLLALDIPGMTYSARPIGHAGPLTVANGILSFSDTEVNRAAFAAGTLLGTDDLTLGLAALSVGAFTTTAVGKIPQTISYASGAELCGREAKTCAAQTVELGTPGEPVFVRRGKGAALALADLGTANVLDGSGVRFVAKGSVETDANGILTGPVFGLASSDSTMSPFRFDFLTVDAEDGNVLKAATEKYADDFSEDASAIVRVGETRTVSADVAAAGLLVDEAKLTLADDVTLRLGGSADCPACLVLNTLTRSATIDGKSATIDFGASEGIIAASRTTANDYVGSIACKIAGTGGLTVFTPEHGHQYGVFELSGANTYSGGTWLHGTELRVRANIDTVLGTGTVHLDGGAFGGGRLRFLNEGTLTNDLSLCGLGPFTANTLDMELGCLVFNADVTLTGAVNIRNFARVSNAIRAQGSRTGFNYQPGTGVFAGTISGGCLRVETDNPSEYARKPIVLAAANSYTGGTFVAGTVLTLRGAGTAGTGFVDLCNGSALRFENDADKVFPNDIRGYGTIMLAGSGDVTFTGRILDKDDQDFLSVDLAGTAPVLKRLPPFRRIFNLSGKKATLTLTADNALDPAQALDLGNVDLVLDGATLDLGGQALTVRRLVCKNGGKAVNGTVEELKPVQGMLLIVR